MLKAPLVDAAHLGFARKGPHIRLLQVVPLSFVAVDHGELAGAAMALKAQAGRDRAHFGAPRTNVMSQRPSSADR